MSASFLVRMENRLYDKYLKTLERVKGIEPSYSAWKAAALPLSYTRAADQLSRPASGLNHPVYDPCAGAALNAGRFAVYIGVSTNNERR